MTRLSVQGPQGQALDDPERLEALRRTGLLDSAPEESFDRFTRIVGTVLHVPLTQISLVATDREFYKSRRTAVPHLAAETEAPATGSVCQYVVTGGEPLVIDDAREDPALAGGGAVARGLVAYCGFPLRLSDGHVLGTLCAVDFAPRDWTPDEVLLIEDLAAMVVAEIELRTALEVAHERASALEDAATGVRALQSALDETTEARALARKSSLELAATIAHEVRTPLFAIRGLAEVMLAEEPAGTLASDVEMIDRTAQEALELIGEQLQLARAEAGHVAVHPREHSIEETLGALRGMMMPVPRAADVALVFEPPPPGASTLVTDQGKLAQILRNLVTNALRHTSAGEVRVRAELVDDDRLVAFVVSDTGSGIPADDLDRIFEPFMRVGDQRDDRGAGLGLPLARQLAQLLGGTVTVRSTLGEGSTFTATVLRRYVAG